MVRGPVVAVDARAWSAGRMRSSDYFARARQRALETAISTVRGRLRRGAADDDENERATN
jgi:hypothetical protein